MPTGGGGGAAIGVLAGHTFYHGTSDRAAAGIQRGGFDLTYASTGGDTVGGTGSPDVAAGVYLSEDPELAATYASQMEAAARGGYEEPSQELSGDKGTVVQTQVNVDKVAEGPDRERLFDETVRQMRSERMAEGHTPEQVRYGIVGSPEFASRLTQTAQAQGYQAMRASTYGGDELIVFDPKNISVAGANKLG